MNINLEISKEVKLLQKLEVQFEEELIKLDEILGSLKYHFNGKNYKNYQEKIIEIDNIYKEFTEKGSKVSEEIKDLEREGKITEKETIDLYEELPYSDDFDHEMAKGDWCKCILEWGKLKGNSDWYKKRGELLKDDVVVN